MVRPANSTATTAPSPRASANVPAGAVEHPRRRGRVEGRVGSAGVEEPAQAGPDPSRPAGRVGEGGVEVGAAVAHAVQVAAVAGRGVRRRVVADAEQRVEVQQRHPGQRQRDGVGGDVAGDRLVLRHPGPDQFEPGDRQLVGRGHPARRPPVDDPAGGAGGPAQRPDVGVGQQPLDRPQPDAVVGGEEVEERAPRRRGLEPGRPRHEGRGVAGEHGVGDERRQRELVHGVRLARRRDAEVRDVLDVRHVRLRDEHHVGGDVVEHRAEDLHDGVGLGQVDRRAARVLPEERDGVEADRLGTVIDVAQQHLGHRHQHGRVAVLEVDLVDRERRPDPLVAADALVAVGDRTGAGPHDGRRVGALGQAGEEVGVGRVAVEEAAEPRARRGEVVDDGVGHPRPAVGQPGHVGPVAEGRLDDGGVDDAEPAVARRGVERQGVHARRRRLEVVGEEPGQRRQRRLAGCGDVVRVGDHPRLALVEHERARRPPVGGDALVERGAHGAGPRSVEQCEQRRAIDHVASVSGGCRRRWGSCRRCGPGGTHRP